MKSIKLTILALSVMALGLGSCSKECDVTPAAVETNAANQRTFIDGSSLGFYNGNNEEITFAAATDVITIKGAFPGKDCGKVQLKRRIMDNLLNTLVDDPNFVAPADIQLDGTGSGAYAFTVDHATAGNGIYYYSVHFVSSGRDCDFRAGFVPELSIEIKDNCSGFTLSASEASINGNEVSFDLVVKNCTGGDVNYKLQGGLVAGATLQKVGGTISTASVSNQAGFTFSEKNKNTILTWNTTLRNGETFSTKITYTINKNLTNGMNVSGSWSAKDVTNVVPVATLPNITVITN